MTGTVSFDWLDSGKPLAVKPIPLNGNKELNEIKRKFSRAIFFSQCRSILTFHSVVLGAYRVLQAKGVEAAKEAWDSTLTAIQMNHDDLTWSLDEFETRFMAYFEETTLRQLSAKDYTEAKDKLSEELKALDKSISEENVDAGADIESFLEERTSAEIYWRLKASGARKLTPPGGKEVAIDWSAAAKHDTLAALGDFASAETLAEFRKAEKKRKEPLSGEDFEMPTEEVVVGKSKPSAESSTKSSGDSPPSSELTSETAEPLGTPTHTSG